MKKVKKTIIKQLLDDLLEDEILNDGEVDSILEENPSTGDKARCLIDTVKSKGDKASRKLIAHLQERDKELHSALRLSSSQPAPAAAGPVQEQGWSTTMISSTEDFWSEKQKTKIYPVTRESMRSRVALLITNIEFTDKKQNRNGANKDEENMEEQLTRLGYEVVKHRNLTARAIDDALIRFSKHPKLRGTDSVVVVIMSHGKRGIILGVDWKKNTPEGEKPDEFPIDNIYKHLGPKECPALQDKPKIIIIQACRGEKRGSVLVSDAANSDLVQDDVRSSSAGEDDIEEDTLKFVHQEKDFISLLSCTPDTVSYRSTEEGSFLIQYLNEVLNTFAHAEEIEVLFRRVMQRFEEFNIGGRMQMPTRDRCTLVWPFFFFPGL